jgi:hypothetical protein
MTDMKEMSRLIMQHNRRRKPRRKHPAKSKALSRSEVAAGARAARASLSGGGSHSGQFERVRPGRYCPICHHDSLCLIARDGRTVLCGRIENDHPCPNALGDLWAHHLAGAPSNDVQLPRDLPPPPPCKGGRASPELRDRAYRAVLARLNLWDMDIAALERRGLGKDAIQRGLYRTLPFDGRSRLLREVIEVEDLAQSYWTIPGFRRSEKGNLTLVGPAGLVIPVLDAEGRVVALKLRRRTDDGPRYTYCSAAPWGGASAEAALHVPARARELLNDGADALFVTEGELKADVITELLGLPCVSIPGVGSWRTALEAVERWQPQSGVILAFDMDRFTKPAVQRAQDALVAALTARGVRSRCAEWDAGYKGFDDYLAAKRGQTTATGAAESESVA